MGGRLLLWLLLCRAAAGARGRRSPAGMQVRLGWRWAVSARWLWMMPREIEHPTSRGVGDGRGVHDGPVRLAVVARRGPLGRGAVAAAHRAGAAVGAVGARDHHLGEGLVEHGRARERAPGAAAVRRGRERRARARLDVARDRDARLRVVRLEGRGLSFIPEIATPACGQRASVIATIGITRAPACSPLTKTRSSRSCWPKVWTMQ